MEDLFVDKLKKALQSSHSKKSLFKKPVDILQKHYKSFHVDTLAKKSKIKILLLNSTCNGFGDVVFAMKLLNYITTWYPHVKCKIATNNPKLFITLGLNSSSLILLKSKSKNIECKRFNQVIARDLEDKHDINLNAYDLYFVAPLTMDFLPDYSEIHNLVKNSNKFNTFFFSEYNYPLNKYVLFNTGLGDDRMGLLMTDKEPTKKIPSLKNPYSVVYIAENDSHLENCYLGFLELLTKKYQLPKLDIVCPAWMVKRLHRNRDKVVNSINEWYYKIVITTKGVVSKAKSEAKGGEDIILLDEVEPHGKGILTFRTDVLPLPFKQMQSLYNYSVEYILVSGDGSITDVLSCCSTKKVPFYQGLPWKQSFYTSLAKLLPNKYFKHNVTSCGNVSAINYHPKFQKFISKWDFRKRAKVLLDSVIVSATIKNKWYGKFKKEVIRRRKVKLIKNELL